MMHNSLPVVYVVDSDFSVRQSLQLLIRNAGWRSETFASASEFLAFPKANVPCCLILDFTLPDMNGLELQQRISAERSDMPVIFLTGDADIPTAVRAFKRGALEFLTKPSSSDILLNALQIAIRRSIAAQSRENELHALHGDYQLLTQRERQVMKLVVSGLLNKQVGLELGISEITVKAHRGSVMRKMRASSLPHLVNIASKLRVARYLATSAA
jgi:FixJ family two-component response regulator